MLTRLANFFASKEALFALILFSAVLIYIPFKIMSYGWAPSDDALRHVAFSLSERSWGDIVVIKPEFNTDHNAGWHSVLRYLHKLGLDKADLLTFSVAGLFLLVNFAGLLLVPYPAAWVTALMIVVLTEPAFLYRLLLGRPYLVGIACSLFLFKTWFARPDAPSRLKPAGKYLLSLIFISLTVWIHGSWYLFFLLPFSLILAGRVKPALGLLFCIIPAVLIGAWLTGDFSGFLYFHTVATAKIFTEDILNWMKVTEFKSGIDSIQWVYIAGLMLLYLAFKKKSNISEIFSDPLFLMVLLCRMLGIMTERFWSDWGIPALLFWFALRLSEISSLTRALENKRVKYGLALFAAVTTVFIFTHDSNARFSSYVLNPAIDFSQKNLKDWAPGKGGIVYSNTESVFYKHFYEYPDAGWKYILGFESALMPDEDRAIRRQISYNQASPIEFVPWVKKMRPEDRLILYFCPNLDEIEWVRGSRFLWIGRRAKIKK
ncbi:MAG: hypothetical protein ACOX2I_14250 [Candidatus Ozemobacteraceae bacterium]|jgi:hypothetical protein